MLSNTIHPRGTLLQRRYRVIEAVGTGGYGVVYKAEDTSYNDYLVAVKSINLAGLSTQEVIEATEAFNREVTLLSNLRHASLPLIHDHFTDPEHWYMVMDFIEGETLEDYITHADPDVPQNGTRCLPLPEVLDIGMQLCTALGYLHMQEPAIIFRDLKPANIMRMADGHLSLIDFGIARRFTQGQAKDTIPLGSPGYAAPEQYGRTQTTPRSDIYSLGAVLHQLVTGDDPAESPFQFAHLLTEDNAVLKALDELLLQMVERDERNRPGSITIVKRRLQQIQSRMSPAQIVQTPVKTRKIRVSRRVFVGALAAAAVTGVLIKTIPPGFIHLYESRSGDYADPARASRSYGTAHYIYRQHKGAVTTVGWSPRGDMIASGDDYGIVHIWRPDTGETLWSWTPQLPNFTQKDNTASFSPQTETTVTLAWSPGGDQLAINDGKIHIWDITKKAFTFSFTNGNYISNMAWSPDGKYIATRSYITMHKMQIWKVGTTQEITIALTDSGNPDNITWSADSRYIATSGDYNMLYFWDITTTRQVDTYTYQAEPIDDVGMEIVAWSPDGKWIVVVGSSATDFHDTMPDVVMILPVMAYNYDPLLVYRRHHNGVSALAWSPDSKHIASAAYEETIQIWNATTGQIEMMYSAFNTVIHSISWSPNGSMIASGSDDGTVQVWRPFQS